MKNLSVFVLVLIFFIFSCTPETRELNQPGIREITEKEFLLMVKDGEVDHVEADEKEKEVFVFLTDEAAQKRDIADAPQFRFPISSYDAFLNEMEALDREYIVHPAR